MERTKAKKFLEAYGFKGTSSVSAMTDVLIAGENPGARKLALAKEPGTKVPVVIEGGMCAYYQ